MKNECGLPAALARLCSSETICSGGLKRGISREFPNKLARRDSSQFFRPLLYQLSYLGGNSILCGRVSRGRDISAVNSQFCELGGRAIEQDIGGLSHRDGDEAPVGIVEPKGAVAAIPTISAGSR